MNQTILLDAGPIGIVTNPKASPENLDCNKWLEAILRKGYRVFVPEIADYEIRRELLRANKLEGIKRLDQLIRAIGYIPLSTETMLKAAEFWAKLRKDGQPTADDKALDGDVILAAQAVTIIDYTKSSVLIATTNVGHLSRLTPAYEWREIK